MKYFLVLLALVAGQASAGTAFLVSCQMGNGGAIGTYQFNGVQFTRLFPGNGAYCPQSINF